MQLGLQEILQRRATLSGAGQLDQARWLHLKLQETTGAAPKVTVSLTSSNQAEEGGPRGGTKTRTSALDFYTSPDFASSVMLLETIAREHIMVSGDDPTVKVPSTQSGRCVTAESLISGRFFHNNLPPKQARADRDQFRRPSWPTSSNR